MLKRIFPFLKRNLTQDPLLINRIFVTLYITYNNVSIYNSFVSRYVINNVDEDYKVLRQVLDFLEKQSISKLDLEDMIKLFEFVISPSDRIVTGAIYTPSKIRKRILENCLSKQQNLSSIRVADIACGCGGFLMDVAKYIHKKTGKSYLLVYQENIFGIDIQSYSIERCKILLNLLAISEGECSEFEFNLLNADTLDFLSEGWNTAFNDFDVIVGNPPYVCGRNMEDGTKEKTKMYEVCNAGSTDLYIPFFQIAIEMIKENGMLGYITMNTFLKSLNARELRKYFMEGSYNISIVDFRGHQVFSGKSTYTCLFFLKKEKSEMLHYYCDENAELSKRFGYTDIPYSILDAEKGWNLNEHKVASKLESVGIPLAKFCQSRHGIATLSNKTYIFTPIDENDKFYYLEKETHIYQVEKEICKDIVNSNKLNSDISLDKIKHKVIFPYQLCDGKAFLIDENVMKHKFPMAYKYLESQRDELARRDKGKGKDYPVWYAYGRTQSLVMPSIKLFFPKIANKPLRCVIVNDPNLWLYNGMAFVGDDERKMKVLQKILESRIFWNYVVANSKPYSSGYYSLNGANIKNFGIPYFTENEENDLLQLQNKDDINELLCRYYK
ncbi:N-6 DNA methylase [Segatella copri]|uniref:HsdM family class I SAM-dependent methyltransferase n=1 Tax=Segatella copri TaxID=165179 RepID=UPI00294B5164|nr:N-6 DNA methylase [Segatella copri]WOG03226.1 N-6 DNA methylase [Segatella copri]